jgi:GR25 family glycosyltransferase involved in LPS biosynthesis
MRNEAAEATVPVYVINLDRDEERLRTFLATNAQLTGVERFSAVDGRLVDRADLERAGLIASNLTYNNGVLGCALSHLELWRRAVADQRPITVVEDDAILAANFMPAHQEVIGKLPADWSIVLWGWNFDRSVWAEIPEGVAKSVLQFNQDELRANIETFRGAEVAHAPIRLRHAFGSLAYSVSPTGAAALLEHCLPLARKFIRFEGFGIGIPNNGIDCIMLGAYPTLKAYFCMPPLAVSENRHEISHTHGSD